MSQEEYNSYLDHDVKQSSRPHDDAQHSNLDIHDHNHEYDYANMRKGNEYTLILCIVITLSFAIVECISGYITNSIALQSDALHMLTDTAGLFIAFIANKISKRPATIYLSFGYGKAEALGALINCIFTVILTGGLIIEIIMRFMHPAVVHGNTVFIVAFLGIIVNGFIAFILSKNSHSLNIKAAFIHTMGDLLASLITVIAGVIIIYTQINIVDPLLSILLVLILLISNYNIIKKSMRVLMAGVPEYLNYQEVGNDLMAVVGVSGIHDLHIWYLTANTASLSAHIIANDPVAWPATLLLCQEMLQTKHNIHHVTLQYELSHTH